MCVEVSKQVTLPLGSKVDLLQEKVGPGQSGQLLPVEKGKWRQGKCVQASLLLVAVDR